MGRHLSGRNIDGGEADLALESLFSAMVYILRSYELCNLTGDIYMQIVTWASFNLAGFLHGVIMADGCDEVTSYGEKRPYQYN